MDEPRPTVGVVGAGQLARMCWQAAIGLDVDLRVLAARADDAAAAVLPDPHIGDADDPDALRRFAAV
jgi:5-(carboxyamino)imidazole ribonucleotide synthase